MIFTFEQNLRRPKCPIIRQPHFPQIFCFSVIFLPFSEGFLASRVRDPGPGTRGSEAEGVRSGGVETPGLRPGSCVGGVFAVRRASAVGPGRPMLGSVLFIG